MRFVVTVSLALACFSLASAQSAPEEQQQKIPLAVPAGTPLRIYLTRRVSKQAGAPVEAKLLEPLYAFDREVVPAGTKVTGRVSRIEPVSKSARTQAVLNGDFTPLRRAYLEFTALQLPDGHELPLHTIESTGLNSLVARKPSKAQSQQPQNSNGGVLGTGRQAVEDQIHTQIDRVKSIPGLVRDPDRKEKAEDYLMSRLPYHSQYVRNGTRFDAELRDPLDFGSVEVKRESMGLLGTQPSAESLAHARLLTPLDSRDSEQGQPVQALLSEPVFSSDHKLILPEGTRLDGTVVLAKKARSFHRGGHLRFTFQGIQLPEEAQLLMATPTVVTAATSEKPKELQFRTEAMLKATENGTAPLKVDGEGGVQTKESKTRFIGTAVAVLVARTAGDNDPIRAKGTRTVIGQNQNVAGRTLGGGLGFGLLGAAISQSNRWVGAAFGYYGMAWSVYSTVIARGDEVQFNKDAAVDIGFNPRQPATASK